MKYFLLLISSFFLVAPITTFASTPTKELRIVDHQVYLFDGNKKIQLTTRGNANIIEGEFGERLLGYEPNYSMDECGVKVTEDKCWTIGYRILFQNKDIAIVKRLKHFVETDGNLTSIFVINLNGRKLALQDITDHLPFYRDVYDSSTIDYRSSRLFADKNGTIFHILKTSLDQEHDGFEDGVWYMEQKERQGFVQSGYTERKIGKTNIILLRKKVSLEQIKALMK